MSQNSLNDSGTPLSKTSDLKPVLAMALASLEVQLDQELTRYRRTRHGVAKPNYNTGEPQNFPGKRQTSIQTPPNHSPEPISSSIAPLVAQSTEEESLLSPDHDAKQPEDYLESSEALLRSLTTANPHQPDSLLSPMGIISMLLLLVASLSLGYAVFNPQSWPQLKVGKLFNSRSAPENPQGVRTATQPPDQTVLAPIPKYPNLAAKEFSEVRDPIDVVGLKPKVQPLPTPLILPPIVRTTPLAKPTLTPPQLNAQIKPLGDGPYYIVTDNQGSSALATVKQVVPDAYLSRNRKIIYLGALRTKEEAQKRLQQLQHQGIKAHLQRELGARIRESRHGSDQAYPASNSR